MAVPTRKLAHIAFMLPMCGAVGIAAAQDAPVVLPPVTVIGTTPLPGVGLTKDEIAAPVQTATGREIDRSHAIDLSGFMVRFLDSVYVNDIQNNPFQPNISYRGYTASPLLGTPQGLSVYMDGVRMNQPFGDVVSWDILPRSAISTMTLMPGSNPVFGLNTLGGAISVTTKDGISNPGGDVQAYYGSYARRAVEFEYGTSAPNGFHAYVTGNLFAEHGWREESPSRVGQIFSKIGWHQADTDISLTAAYADTNLNGLGLQNNDSWPAIIRASIPSRTRRRITPGSSIWCWRSICGATSSCRATRTTATSARRRATTTSTTNR